MNKKYILLILTLLMSIAGFSSWAQTLDSAKIKAVESGLEGAFKTKEQKPWTIWDRMHYYRIKPRG